MDIDKLKDKLLSKREIKPSPDGRFQDCWYWTGSKYIKNGYGRMYVIETKTYMRVHRLSANLWLGFDLNSELLICHSCDNKICFNPEHLFIGTHKDNNQDTVNKNRHVGNKKVSDQIILAIRDLFNKGFNRNQLMLEFNIPYETISGIVSNKTHKHLT